jgi:hypothetical protein
MSRGGATLRAAEEVDPTSGLLCIGLFKYCADVLESETNKTK